MPVYYPQMAAVLDVPTADGRLSIPMHVRSATLESNNHLQADELELEAEVADVGVDPRFVRNAEVSFWLANMPADARPGDVMAKSPRFVGVADRVERKGSEDGLSVSIKALDYTSFFLAAKPFPTDGVPLYTDTIGDAWRRICDHTGLRDREAGDFVSTVGIMRDNVRYHGAGVSADLTFAKSAPSRLAKLGGRIPVPPGADAWAVWQQVIGTAGLLSFIEGDHVVVTDAIDHFRDDAEHSPHMVWGSNILDFTETARGEFSRKGVALSSFDPLTGTTIEAFYPPPGDPRLGKSHTAAKRSRAAAPLLTAQDYDWQAYNGITDKDALATLAKLVWEQRSRQEMEGQLVTREMSVSRDGRIGGDQIDLLDLRTGDSLFVDIEPAIHSGTFSTLTPAQKVAHLRDRGYAPGAADLIVSTWAEHMRRGLVFKVKRVRTRFSTESDSGEFSVAIEYWNRVDVTV